MDDSTIQIYTEVRDSSPIPDNVEEYGPYMRDVVKRCIGLSTERGRSLNATGNMTGRFFELVCRDVFEKEVGKENITMYVMDGTRHHINEIEGLEAAQMPFPDVIIRNEHNFKGMISIKWGNRHDRLYEIPHSGTTINDLLKRQSKLLVNVYFLTNDDSASRIAILLNDPSITAVYHLVPETIHSNKPETLKTLRRLKGVPELINELKIITCVDDKR